MRAQPFPGSEQGGCAHTRSDNVGYFALIGTAVGLEGGGRAEPFALARDVLKACRVRRTARSRDGSRQ